MNRRRTGGEPGAVGPRHFSHESALPPTYRAAVTSGRGRMSVLVPRSRVMKPVPADQRLLSPADLARLLGVSPRTVRRWAADGSLPAPVRKGTRYIRWRVADVQRFLGAHTDCAAPPLTPALRD